MKLAIKDNIFTNFTNAIIGVLVVKRVNNRGVSTEIDQLLSDAEAFARKEFSSLESPSKHPNILPWREAYKKFGSDPHDYRCSSEALARQALKGNHVGGINKLVDLYNYISLKYVLPVGGEDLDKTVGDITLTKANGDEPFVRLGGTENEPPQKGEVVYKDEKGFLCRRWNWREADRTKLTEDTQKAMIVVEALPPVSKEMVENSIKELGGLVQTYCGGEYSYKILQEGEAELVIA